MSATSTQPSPPNPPVLKATSYDIVSSFLVAIVLALVIAVATLVVLWVSTWESPSQYAVPVERIELPGGDPDGVPNETLSVESPADPSEDPSLAEVPEEETQVEQVLDNVLELAENATNITEQQFELSPINTGKPGSAKGTGRRPLGMGPGVGGFPREQRWFVRFSDSGTLDEYARQLDFFGIELGALLQNREIVYVSDLSAKQPKTRRAKSGRDEQRLYMTWQGGGRRKSDVELFKKAGIDVSDGVLFHFYPPATEARLAELERNYAGRPASEIRRTYFGVRADKNGYTFFVTRQSYH